MNNEPAFPHRTGSYGMTLRDYFAAKAMQAVVTSPNLAVFDDDAIAVGAYKIADAMLKAREK